MSDKNDRAAYKRRWYSENVGYKYGFSYLDNPQEYKKLQARDRRARHPMRHTLASAKSRAKKAGVEFNITLEDLNIPSYCPVFGVELRTETGMGKRCDNSCSIDRIDNSKGYIKGNVAVISWRANMMKGNLTIEEVESLLKYMKGY